MNEPCYRAEQTGLAQTLRARLSLRLRGLMPPNTQMDCEGRQEWRSVVGHVKKNNKMEIRELEI